MNVLYVATDQRVPGSTGGSVHVEEVARGLAHRGHQVDVLARPAMAQTADLPFMLHPSPRRASHRLLRWTAERDVGRLIEDRSIDVVLERYYNFAGEGVRAAFARGVPAVLEVNSPVMDHPGSVKAWLDRAMVARPMKRLREGLCRRASALVTPLPAIVPATVPREKIFQIHWGANVERFHPASPSAELLKRLRLGGEDRVVVFSGSFRRWHGADVLVRVAARVLERPGGEGAFFLMIGSGPELETVRREVARLGIGDRIHLTGAVPHAEMPCYLSLGRVGVAPFQPSRHGQLRLGFYWSPLKIFEYMAMGLPVVTLNVPPLSEIVRHREEGLLVAENDEPALAEAILSLLSEPERAAAMGRSARERVVAQYSWQVHCERLERVLHRVVSARGREVRC